MKETKWEYIKWNITLWEISCVRRLTQLGNGSFNYLLVAVSQRDLFTHLSGVLSFPSGSGLIDGLSYLSLGFLLEEHSLSDSPALLATILIWLAAL